MAKSTRAKTSFTFGEISPRMLGRFEDTKPVFLNAAAILENIIILQNGSIMFRPATKFVVEVKDSSKKVRLEKFQYSATQRYIMEIGDKYIRFCANGGQLTSGGVPVEVTTIFDVSDIFELQYTNKGDVMWIVHPDYYPQKLIRTSATTFTIANVPFVRGPFLDDNIDTASTITPSAATGTGITLTASKDIFLAGHVGSLWRVNSSATVGAVVKITAFSDTKTVTGDVQAEPDGTAGNIGGTGAYSNWAEGAFSDVRGYPRAITFDAGRLLYGGTTYEPQKWWASVVGAYDNFDKGSAGDSDSYTYELAADGAAIRWMNSDVYLKFGTAAGTVTAKSSSITGITPTTPPNIIVDSDYAVFPMQPKRIGGFLFYLQGNGYQLRQLVYQLSIDRDDSDDMTLLADHILRDRGGAVQMSRQQSPNDRLLLPGADGQISAFTRNPNQAVQGWSRMVAGSTAAGVGLFESCAVEPQDGEDDRIWVVVQRNINGSVKRYIEYFLPELFDYDWEPCLLDCSLSLNSPITITGITNASPPVVTAPSHGLSTDNKVKIDNVVGMNEVNSKHYLIQKIDNDSFYIFDTDGITVDATAYGKYLSGGEARKMVTTLTGLSHLEGETVSVQTDGGLPAAQQTFVVSGGQITLPNPAAVVHVGLPYTGKIGFLPLGDTAQGVTGQMKKRKLYRVFMRVYKSSGGQFGKDENSVNRIIYPSQIPNVTPPMPVLYTGDVELDFESEFDTYWAPVIVLDKPLPFNLLAIVFQSEISDDK